jgi:hypothetical protein
VELFEQTKQNPAELIINALHKVFFYSFRLFFSSVLF